MSPPVRSFSFNAHGVGGHLHVDVRFGAEGQRAHLGQLVMSEDDWNHLAACAGIEDGDHQDEIVLVPPGQPCPASKLSGGVEPAINGARQCPECRTMVRVRGDGMLTVHAWPFLWEVPE